MRVLGIGDYGDLGDLYAHLVARGHQVRMSIADPAYHDVYAGMVERVSDWRAQLPWIREAGDDGIIICETAHQGVMQDDLRRCGFHVIGGCAWGDRLEGDRTFGQSVLRAAGMRTAEVWQFNSFHEAIAFIEARPGRYVVKHNGHQLPSTHTYIGMVPNGSDVIAMLRHSQRHWPADQSPDFVLMQHVVGCETGVGAYFDGQQFVGSACLDWEHKRFFPGDLGELTCEMGTVVTYEGAERLFAETLAPLAPLLAQHGYCGYLNLNTIINDEGVWPLEFTCRFGYPGFAILDALHAQGWEEILLAMCGRRKSISVLPGYAVGVVLTMPPFPYQAGTSNQCRGMPVSWQDTLRDDERRHVHYGDVGLVHGQPVIAGESGYVLVVTGIGADVERARARAYDLITRAVVPHGRYRIDIGERFLRHDAQELTRLGYLPARG
jgi:phosphoribosylamine--glycine ligase